MNSEKVVNGQTIYGPSLRLRGITSSQINTRHAFFIYLTFKIKSSRNRRHLQETEKTILAICEALNTLEESYNDVNIIDYECIGNATQDEDFSNYQLEDIIEGENEGLLKKSNLKELAKEMSNEDFLKKVPEFTIVELLRYATFEINEIKNITSKNYLFDFKIEGKINKEISTKSIDSELELNEIKERAKCIFIIEEDKKANLKCNINIKNHKDKKIFTFKTLEINTDENDIYLARIDEILLINKREEKKGIPILVIILIVAGGLIVISAIITLIICLVRKKAKNNPNTIEKSHFNINGQNNEVKMNQSKEILNKNEKKLFN